MKWNTAIKKIENALNEGMCVEIRYHRKWLENDRHWDTVESLNSYEWNGEKHKAINTYIDMIDEDSHIIDSVEVI